MDSYGMFEKLWQFSAFLVEKGFDIIAVGKEDNFTDGNIERLTKEYPDKFILRACANGKPEYLTQTIGGTPHKAVKVGNKTYIPKI